MSNLDFEKFKLEYNFIPQKDEDFKSYVYEITSKIDNKKYVGVRTSKQSNLEDDFWSYGTSGCRKEDILKNPNNYILKILKVFNNRPEALYYESFLHKKYNVAVNEEYFNRANSNCFDGTPYTINTVIVFDKNDKTNKRVSITEYYKNKNYIAPSTGKVLVRLKNTENFFYISKEEFHKNREKYYTAQEGFYVVEIDGDYKQIKDYEFNPTKHKLISSNCKMILCRKRNSDDLFSRIPDFIYNKVQYETPKEVLKRPENKGKVGVRTHDNKHIYIFENEWNSKLHKPFRKHNSFRVDENNKIFRIKNNDSYNLLSVLDKFDNVYKKVKRVQYNVDKNRYVVFDEAFRTYILNDKEIFLPHSEYLKLKETTDIIMKCAPKGEVPVYDTLTNKKIRISKDEFYSNKDRYIALSSRKMRDLNKN